MYGLSPAADGLPAGPGQALEKSQCPEQSLGITEERHGWAEGEYASLQGGTDLFHLKSILVSLHQVSEVPVSFALAHRALLRMLFPLSWLRLVEQKDRFWLRRTLRPTPVHTKQVQRPQLKEKNTNNKPVCI